MIEYRYVITTPRLRLREITVDDAAFVQKLLNDPDFIRYVGDRGVRDLESAETYIRDRFTKSYADFGYGLWLMELASTGEACGICGLVNREELEDIDIGFGLLPNFRGHGYAFEAASAVLLYAGCDLGLNRIVAITDEGNLSSIRLLEKLGLSFEHRLRLGSGPGEVLLFA